MESRGKDDTKKFIEFLNSVPSICIDFVEDFEDRLPQVTGLIDKVNLICSEQEINPKFFRAGKLNDFELKLDIAMELRVDRGFFLITEQPTVMPWEQKVRRKTSRKLDHGSSG
jgi:hypothetical protein